MKSFFPIIWRRVCGLKIADYNAGGVLDVSVVFRSWFRTVDWVRVLGCGGLFEDRCEPIPGRWRGGFLPPSLLEKTTTPQHSGLSAIRQKPLGWRFRNDDEYHGGGALSGRLDDRMSSRQRPWMGSQRSLKGLPRRDTRTKLANWDQNEQTTQ